MLLDEFTELTVIGFTMAEAVMLVVAALVITGADVTNNKRPEKIKIVTFFIFVSSPYLTMLPNSFTEAFPF